MPTDRSGGSKVPAKADSGVGSEAGDVIVDQHGHEVFKPHQAIAISPSPGMKITLLMRKFFNILLHTVQEQGDKETYRAPLAEIFSTAEMDPRNMEIAKETLRAMAKTTVEWDRIRGDEDDVMSWGISGLLADAEFLSVGGRLFLEWSYSPKVRQRLLDPYRYVQLPLAIFNNFRSGSAAALYEICMKYLTNFDGLTNKAPWEWWKPRISGVNDTKAMGEYRFFKRDTLVPAINEVNAVSGLQVSLLEFKTGRKISHLQFSVQRKPQSMLSLDSGADFINVDVLRRMEALGLTKSTIDVLYAENDPEFLTATLDFVEGRVAKGGVKSPAALFRDALKKGYGATDAAKPAKDEKPAEQEKTCQKSVESESPAPMRSKFDDADDYINGLSESDRADLIDEFKLTLSGIVKEQFDKGGLKSKIVRVALASYVLDNKKMPKG